jgi:hypothetical protein
VGKPGKRAAKLEKHTAKQGSRPSDTELTQQSECSATGYYLHGDLQPKHPAVQGHKQYKWKKERGTCHLAS